MSKREDTNLTVLHSLCGAGSCPTIYVDETSDDVIVQGYLEPIETPSGEAAVRIPRSAFRDTFRNLSVS
jgi:hypothetical protein